MRSCPTAPPPNGLAAGIERWGASLLMTFGANMAASSLTDVDKAKRTIEP
jgi:hypothetical protein